MIARRPSLRSPRTRVEQGRLPRSFSEARAVVCPSRPGLPWRMIGSEQPPRVREVRTGKFPRASGPKAPMTRRTRGREIALQVLYQLEQNPGQGPADVELFIQRRLREPKLCAFASTLIEGVRQHQPRIDALISEVAENWRLDRMAAIDRNILRLGAYELLYCTGTVPAKVAINEALELAKRYSTAQSSRFVNGILDRLQAAGAAQLPAGAARPDPEFLDTDPPTAREEIKLPGSEEPPLPPAVGA
jgi:N utilization substance protein B